MAADQPRRVTDFTALAFAVLGLLDTGHLGELSVENVNAAIRGRTLFHELQQRYDDELDLSRYDEASLQRIITEWQELVASGAWRTLGVTHDGLCLLVAYCLASVERIDPR